MSNIIVVGATGTIGRAVADLLSQTHAVVRVGHSTGDATVDLASKAYLASLDGGLTGQVLDVRKFV